MAKYYCEPCELPFSNGVALDRHIEEAAAEGKPGHLFCKKCDAWQPNPRAMAMHNRKAHPVSDNLKCPACHMGPFQRVEDFLEHIEKSGRGSNHCPITMDLLKSMRDENMKFMRALSKQRGYQDRFDYSEFVCHDRSVIFPSGPVPQDTWWNEPDEWAGPSEWDEAPDLWASEKVDEKETEVMKGSSDENAAAKGLIALGKPLPPGATTDDCWNPVTCRYNCPNPGCLKTFPKPQHLVYHLKGAEHKKEINFRCPGCMKRFLTLKAQAAHCTNTTSSRCCFRRNSGFGAFIDQLTGGIIEVLPDLNPDGSERYQVTEKARKMFAKKGPLSTSVEEPAATAAAPAVANEDVSAEEDAEKEPVMEPTLRDDGEKLKDRNPAPAAEVRMNDSDMGWDFGLAVQVYSSDSNDHHCDNKIQPTGYLRMSEPDTDENADNWMKESKERGTKPRQQGTGRRWKLGVNLQVASQSTLNSQMRLKQTSPVTTPSVEDVEAGSDARNNDGMPWWW